MLTTYFLSFFRNFESSINADGSVWLSWANISIYIYFWPEYKVFEGFFTKHRTARAGNARYFWYGNCLLIRRRVRLLNGLWLLIFAQMWNVLGLLQITSRSNSTKPAMKSYLKYANCLFIRLEINIGGMPSGNLKYRAYATWCY